MGLCNNGVHTVINKMKERFPGVCPGWGFVTMQFIQPSSIRWRGFQGCVQDGAG